MSSGSLENEHSYHYRRAEQELERAQQADHPAAVKAHYVLAGFYLDRVYGSGEPRRDGLTA